MLGPLDFWNDDDVRRLSATARRMAMLWCNSHHDAEDVAQEALVQFIRQCRRPRNPEAWMYVVTRRLWSREISRARTRAYAEAEFRTADAAWDPTPAFLEAATIIGRLGACDRVLLLRVLEGALSRDIARELGCHVHNVGQKVARARKRARLLRGLG